MKSIRFLAYAITTTVLFSCSSDDDNTTYDDLPLGAYDNGVLILNEGNFGSDNSTLSFLSDDFATFQADAYSAVNSETLGNTGQSIGFYNEFAFVIVNGSNKIKVLNRYTLAQVATISSGISNPRYIAFANGKGYVTNWGDAGISTDDFVAIINLSTYTVESTITVDEGPEKIIEENNKLYVLHEGGYSFGTTISVINPATNTVINEITVSDVPTGIEEENGYLYVMCSGVPNWATWLTETAGKLVKVNLSDLSVTEVISFATTEHPANLDVEDGNAYYTLNSVVYKVNLNATTAFQSTTLINLATTQGTSYDYAYGFAVGNNKIYVGDAKDFSSNGKVYVYSINGVLENEFEVKANPNGFYFN